MYPIHITPRNTIHYSSEKTNVLTERLMVETVHTKVMVGAGSAIVSHGDGASYSESMSRR